jgi:hypothetical protein
MQEDDGFGHRGKGEFGGLIIKHDRCVALKA